MPFESEMLSNHLILSCPLLLPSVFPSIRVFSSESALRIRWPKYWCFSFSISPSNEYSGLISFQADSGVFSSISSLTLSLLYGQTLTSIHDYWKNHYFLTVWTFVSKVMSLLSRLVIAFLLRSKCLIIS